MKVSYRKDALKDIRKVKDGNLTKKIKNALKRLNQYENVHQMIQDAKCKKMQGSDNAFRIRIGDYRVGFYATDEKIIVHRILNRQDMYNKFPERGYVTEKYK